MRFNSKAPLLGKPPPSTGAVDHNRRLDRIPIRFDDYFGADQFGVDRFTLFKWLQRPGHVSSGFRRRWGATGENLPWFCLGFPESAEPLHAVAKNSYS